MRSNLKSVSIMAQLKKLGTRAALVLFAFLLLNKGKKKKVSQMIKEATMGGHMIKYEKKMSRTRNEDGEFEVDEPGHTVFITPTAWIERRRALIAQAAITEYSDELIMNEKGKRGSGPRTFTIDGQPVLAIKNILNDTKTVEVMVSEWYEALPTCTHFERTALGNQPVCVDFVWERKEVTWESRPIVREYLVPSVSAPGGSEWITMDHRTLEGASWFAKFKQQGWDLRAWVDLPCMLTEEEREELKLLDLVYRVAVDMGLQQQKFLAKSDAKEEKIAAIEQDRTKGGVAEFSGRPDDGMEGFVGGGAMNAREFAKLVRGSPVYKDGVHVWDTLVPGDADGKPLEQGPVWAMDEESVTIAGYPVPQRPTKAQFMRDEVPGWTCRLDMTKNMVIMAGEDGKDIWLDTASQAFKELDPQVANRLPRVKTLKAKAVRVEAKPNGACNVYEMKGNVVGYEPVNIVRRHLHNLLNMGRGTYVLKPYVCQVCQGYGMVQGQDPESGELQGEMVPCHKCRGSGAGAPGYHMNYETGLAEPNQTVKYVAALDADGRIQYELDASNRMIEKIKRVTNVVTKPEAFACRGKGSPCGSREFITDIHAEVCVKCGAEMWKNSMVALFDLADMGHAISAPEGATHVAVQVYGQLVKDMVRARMARVKHAKAMGKKIPPTIGTKVAIIDGKMAPTIPQSLIDMQPRNYKIRGSLAHVVGMLNLKPKVKGWEDAVIGLMNKPEHKPTPKRRKISLFRHAFDPKPMGQDALGVEDVLHTARTQALAFRSDDQVRKQLISSYEEWTKKARDQRRRVSKEMGR